MANSIFKNARVAQEYLNRIGSIIFVWVAAHRKLSAVLAVSAGLISIWLIAALWMAFSLLSRAERVADFQLVPGDNLTDRVALTLEELDADVGRTRRIYNPIIFAGRALNWVPVIGNELQAAERLFDKTDSLLGRLVKASEQSEFVQAELVEASNNLAAGNLTLASENLISVSNILDSISFAEHRSRDSEDGSNYLIPLSDRVTARFAQVEYQLSQLDTLKSNSSISAYHAATFLDHLRGLNQADTQSSGQESPSVTTIIADTEKLLTSITELTESVSQLQQEFQVTNPLVERVIETLPVIDDLVSSSLAFTAAVNDYFACRENHGAGEFCEIQNVLNTVSGNSGLINTSRHALTAMESVVADLSPDNDLVGKISSKANPQIDKIDLGIKLISALAGVESPSSIMILGMSSDELRPTGGFVSSVWTVVIENGNPQAVSYIDVLDFDQAVSAGEFPVPDGMATHMDAKEFYLRDFTWEPEFDVVGALATSVSKNAGEFDPDHVIGINQQFIVELTTILGGFESNGQILTPQELLELFETGTDSQGRAFLSTFAQDLIDSALTEGVSEHIPSLARYFNSALQTKDVLVYSNDSEVQQLLSQLEWSRPIPVDLNDRLAVFDSNVGWNKADRGVNRTVKYDVQIRVGEVSSASLRLEYEKEIGDLHSCPQQGSPTAETTYSELKDRCYWNYVRAYLANGAEITDHLRLPAIESSVAVRSSKLTSGEDTFIEGFDSLGNRVEGLVRTNPMGFAAMEFSYRLPESVLTEITPGEYQYQLNIVTQSGSNGRNYTIRLSLPEGAKISSHNYGDIDGTNIVVNEHFEEDISMLVRFTIQSS